MNWKFKKPIFTKISPVVQARALNRFDLEWTYPSYFTLPTESITTGAVVGYRLYRHIERKYPAAQATGGPLKDPTSMADTLSSISNPYPPVYKVIATLPATASTYTDYLNDLYVHADEGITFNGVKWVDGSGADIKDEIFHTARRIYYKIEALDSQMIFNNLPFIYIAHRNGVECRSTINQVKFNTLYREGETVWYNDALDPQSRIAVDPIFEPENNRQLNVWCSGSGNTVTCLNGYNGEVIRTYTTPLYDIGGIKIDPETGDAIVTGSGTGNVYRCILFGGGSVVVTIPSNLKALGNAGLVIAKISDVYKTYMITNKERVDTVNMITLNHTTGSYTMVGSHPSVNNRDPNIPNALGITNASDNGIWTNGHIPVHLYYTYSYQQTINEGCAGLWTGGWTTTGCICWACVCASGTAASCTRDSSCCWWDKSGEGGSWCEPRHCTDLTSTVTVTVTVDTWFLQDIGFVYGVGDGNNRGVTNGQAYDGSSPIGYPLASPYGSGTYSPFTSRDDRSGAGWRGDSFEVASVLPHSNVPYTGSNGSTPSTNPNPAESQFGLVADLKDMGSSTDGYLTTEGNTYNVWQTNYVENKIHKLEWNGVTLTYNSKGNDDGDQGTEYVDWWPIGAPTHACTDSQNNIWVIKNRIRYAGTIATQQLGLIYQLDSGTIFPMQGDCLWPSYATSGDALSGITESYVYGAPYNDRFIEYYLTRDTTFAVGVTDVPSDGYRSTYGVVLSGNIAEQKLAARIWTLSGTNYSTAGIKVYPNFNTAYTNGTYQTSFVRDPKGSTDNNNPANIEYNSDNNGYLFACTEHWVRSWPAFVRPLEQYPSSVLTIHGLNSTPQNCDGLFWQNQILQNTNNTSTSGYDDFNVGLRAVNNAGSFYTLYNVFYFDDKYSDYDGSINPPFRMYDALTTEIEYTYDDPSMNGKPNQPRWADPGFLNPNGMATPYHAISSNDNVYWLSGDIYSVNPSLSWMASADNVFSISNTVTATIFERWPTARFWIDGYDTSALRRDCLSAWYLSSVPPTGYTYPIVEIGNEIDEDRLVIGYAPLSARFWDWSISRTLPISSWYWNFDDDTYYGFNSATEFSLTDAYLYLSAGGCLSYTYTPTAFDNSRTPQNKEDCLSYDDLQEHLYVLPGRYCATLYVEASNTGTTSMPISAGVTDQSLMTWNACAVRCVEVKEICPGLNIGVVSGRTVPSTYSDTNDGVFHANPICAADLFDFTSSAYGPISAEFKSISGYAPNLTVMFSAAAVARSLPLCAMVIDYGDMYDDSVSAYLVCSFPSPSVGWPTWGQQALFISGEHVYTMPGLYDVSIYARTRRPVYIGGSIPISSTVNCDELVKNYIVYAKEIIPSACFTFGTEITAMGNTAITGVSPQTIYFNPSCTNTGSFAICKIVWDFGDGSELLTISRVLSSDISMWTNTSSFSADLEDPRNIIVNHEYTRTNNLMASTISASMSAFACNTNTESVVIQEVATLTLPSLANDLGEVHLIANRIPNDTENTMLTFESQKNTKLFNVLVSAVSV